MVLNNFAESDYFDSLEFSRRVNGDRGVGFKLTNYRHFDMDFERMCQVGDPDATYDLCTKYYTSSKIHEVVTGINTVIYDHKSNVNKQLI